MRVKSFSEYEQQFSFIGKELEFTWGNVSRMLDELIGSIQGLQKAVDVVNQLKLSAYDSIDEVELSLDGYESELEDLKTNITTADTEIYDHIKLCVDVQCILRELAGKAQNAIKNPMCL